MAVTAVTIALSGCATSDPADTQADTPTAAQSPSPEASAPPTGNPAAAQVADPTVTDSAAAQFSDDQVSAAWQTVTDLAREFAYNPRLGDTAPGDLGASDFTALRAAMTADAQRDWDQDVADIATDSTVSAVAQYRTFTWREGDGDFEEWLQGIAADGWRLWAAGLGASLGGAFHVSVRRLVDRPWATVE